MNKIPITARLRAPHAKTLKKFKNQGLILEQALEHHPSKEIQKELAKQKEVYEKHINESIQRRED